MGVALKIKKKEEEAALTALTVLVFLKKLIFFFLIFFKFRAILAAYGGPQTRGQIGAVAANLYHSHSKVESEPHLQTTPQLTAMLHPYPAE